MALPENEHDLRNYESPFTEDSILAMKNIINASINTYSGEQGKKLDIYVILAALQHASFELIVRTFPKDDEERKAMLNRMNDVANDVLKTVRDTAIREHGGMDSLLGAVHATSILTESLSRTRDKYIMTLRDQQLATEAERTQAPTESLKTQQDEASND